MVVCWTGDSVAGLAPADDWESLADVEECLVQWARQRSRNESEARSHATTPLAFANALVALGEAEACVAGAVHTTADVLRWAL